MNQSKMNPQKKIILSLLVFCFCALIFVVLIIFPLFRGIKAKSKELISQRRIMIETQAMVEKLKEIQITHEIYRQDLESINVLLVNPDTPLALIEFLEEMAENLNLVIEISPNVIQGRENEPWPSLNFSFALAGSFSDFSKFVEKLELSSFPGAGGAQGFLIEILNVDISRLNKETFSSEDVRVVLLIKAYTH